MSKIIKISQSVFQNSRRPLVAALNHMYQQKMYNHSQPIQESESQTQPIEQQQQSDLPYTIEDASKILMNWNYVHGNESLERLRERYVRDDTLNEEEIDEIRNFMINKIDNTNYVCFLIT